MTKHNEGLGVVGRGGGRDVGLGFRIDGSSLVGDLCHVAVVVVRGVLDVLDPAVRESHGVGPGHHLAVTGLRGVEVGLGVVVSHSVLEGVGLLLALGLDVRSWSWSWVDWSWHRGRSWVGGSHGLVDGVSYDRGVVDHGVDHGGVDGSHVVRDDYWGVVDSVVGLVDSVSQDWKVMAVMDDVG